MDNDVLEILFETNDEGVYKVWSENDERIFSMRRSDLEYEQSHGADVVDEWGLL